MREARVPVGTGGVRVALVATVGVAVLVVRAVWVTPAGLVGVARMVPDTVLVGVGVAVGEVVGVGVDNPVTTTVPPKK